MSDLILPDYRVNAGGATTTVYFEEDFTATTTGTMTTDNMTVDEAGDGWIGGAAESNWVYQGDGSGIQYIDGGNGYINHRTSGREDVQQTLHFTMAVGTASGRTSGALQGRMYSDSVSNALLAYFVCNGATTDADLLLLDVDGVSLKTWDVSALAEQVDEDDEIELVMRWEGDDVTFYSIRVNGTLHVVDDTYTLTGAAQTSHGAAANRTQWGMGDRERVSSSANDRITYYKVESIPA